MLIALVPVAAAVIGLVLVLPLLRRTRRRGIDRALPLVPTELAEAHARVVAVAGADAEARRTADDVVVDVAIVLAGYPARGGAQRRFVRSRTDALLDLAAALTAARAEVDALSGVELDEPAEPDTVLAKVMFVVLLPAFLAGDGVRAVVDGTALRLRATARLLADTARRWRHVRAAVVVAVRQARRRFVVARLRAARR